MLWLMKTRYTCETAEARVNLCFSPTEKIILEGAAAKKRYSRLGPFLRHIIFTALNMEPIRLRPQRVNRKIDNTNKIENTKRRKSNAKSTRNVNNHKST